MCVKVSNAAVVGSQVVDNLNACKIGLVFVKGDKLHALCFVPVAQALRVSRDVACNSHHVVATVGQVPHHA
jgi:hypothetical protein